MAVLGCWQLSLKPRAPLPPILPLAPTLPLQLRTMAVLGELHEFIKRENEVGGITRQEAVSMVPPLFLDVQVRAGDGPVWVVWGLPAACAPLL